MELYKTMLIAGAIVLVVVMLMLVYCTICIKGAQKGVIQTLFKKQNTDRNNAATARFNEYIKGLEDGIAKQFFDEARNRFYTTDENGLQHQNLTLKRYEIDATDGVHLSAQYMPCENSNKLVIAVHGHLSSSADILCEAYPFNLRGYNVLLPDLRAHGQSGGNYCGMGVLDSADLLEWIKFINTQLPSIVDIVLFGISMGGATVLSVSDKNLQQYGVTKIISDCAFSSAYQEMKYQLYKNRKPIYPAVVFCRGKVKELCGYDLCANAPIDAVKNSTLPILIIHGKMDKYVPYKFATSLYVAANCYKRIVSIENAGHAVCMHAGFTQYFAAVDEFLGI